MTERGIAVLEMVEICATLRDTGPQPTDAGQAYAWCADLADTSGDDA